MNNLQGQRVPITEQIVGRAGALIGAPTCVVRTIEISPDFAGWEFRPGATLLAGVAHASLNVEPVVQTGSLTHRSDDDNARRHAQIFGLYDWCWGGDPQWLVALAEENRFYSHDHGHFLPNGPNWFAATLETNVDAAHEFAEAGDAITPELGREVSATLRAIQREALRDALGRIPSAWPVTDEELECVGFFLERRAAASAERLTRRFGGVA